MPGDFPSRSFSDFQDTLSGRMRELFYELVGASDRERGFAFKGDSKRHFVMPVGLLFVIDEADGGDITAETLVKRFRLLHAESANIIDFYFLGWKWVKPGDREKGIQFDPQSFEACRVALKKRGVQLFRSDAELILVDAHHWFQASVPGAEVGAPKGIREFGISLDFEQAIHINLSGQRESKDLPPVGEFLSSIIQATDELRESRALGDESGVVFSVSDKLGLATAKQSFLDYILQEWGKIIGAKRLANLATRNIGPTVSLEKLALEGVSQD